MGLPVWREPKPVVEPKSALKSDPTAHARSAIRRQPSVHHRARAIPLPRSPPPPQPQDAAVPPVPPATWRDRLSDLTANSPRTIEYLRARRIQRMLERGADVRRAERIYINNRVAADVQAENDGSLFTVSQSAFSRPQSRRGPSGAADELPPLRRMTGRSINDAAQPTVRAQVSAPNGLGDRQRSPSAESDHWETLLTTITPDPSVPSADSSFNSLNDDSHDGPRVIVERVSPPRSPSTASRPIWAQRARRSGTPLPSDQIALIHHAEDTLPRSTSANARPQLFGSFDHGDINSDADIWPVAPPPPPIPGCDDEEDGPVEGMEQDDQTREPTEIVINPFDRNAPARLRRDSSLPPEEMVARLEQLLERTEHEMRSATEFNARVRNWTSSFGAGERIQPGAETAVRQHMLRMSETLGEILSVADDTASLINQAGLRHMRMGRHESIIADDLSREEDENEQP